MNIWTGTGRLVADPVVSASGKYADTRLAVDKFSYGEKSVQFIPIRFIGPKNAERAKKYLSKGQKILISGELIHEQSKTNGNYYTLILTNSFEFADSKNAPQSHGEEGMKYVPEGLSDDNMPFT